jgi:tetratricopeptide (TPR) repeat protein
MSRSFALLLALSALSSLLAAQTDSRGNCELSVRVSSTDERSVQGQIQVQLLSPQGIVVATAHVVGGDAAEFQVTSGRTYRLTVSGGGIESLTTAYFDINELERMHSETVHVKPEKHKDAGEPTAGSPTISVSEMNIPRRPRGEMDKGLDAYSKGDLEKAAAHFENAIAGYPHYARAYDMLGAIAIKNSNRSKARELFSQSIQADAAFLPAYIDLARMDLQEQQYEQSESLLAKVIALDPSIPDAVALLATTEFANKEYDKALVDVQRTHALANHEQFAEVHIMAGKVLRMQNHRGAAVAQFELFLIEKPDSPEGQSVRSAITALTAGQ